MRDRDTSDPKNGSLDERLYAMQDANWNVTALAISTGSVQERYAYDAYGTARALTPAFAARGSSNYDWESRFLGYRLDAESGLYAVRARTYSPLSSWVQRDPAGFVDGPSLYEYVRSCPLGFVDPSGLGVCEWLTSPCFGNIVSCICSIVGIIDTIMSVIPSELLGPWMIAIDKLVGLADSACDAIGSVANYCFYVDDPLCDDDFQFWGSIMWLLSSAMSCMINISPSMGAIADLAADFISWLYDEAGADLAGLGCGNATGGLTACGNIDC